MKICQKSVPEYGHFAVCICLQYKNPESAGDDARFFYKDKPEQRMERITYHGENIGALEQMCQRSNSNR